MGEGVSVYLQVSRILVLTGSISITAGLYLQAIKLWRTKSASDFAPLLVLSVLYNEIVWLNYGLALWEWPIIMIGLLNIPAAVAIFVGYGIYGNNHQKGVES